MERVRVRVDNRATVLDLPNGSEVAASIAGAFTHDNPQHAAKRALGFSTKGEPSVISTWREHRGAQPGLRSLSVPRGGLSRLRGILAEHGLVPSFQDARSRGAPDLAGEMPDHRFELYPFQEEMVARAIDKENCFLRAGTGSGKTCVGFAIIARLKVPFLVLLPSQALLDQWRDRAETELGIPERDVGIIRGDKFKLRPLTLALPHTLCRRQERAEEINEYFGGCLMDEIQLAAASTFYAAFDMLSCRYRVGISADESRKDRKEFLTRDLFGDEPAAEVKREWLSEHGYTMDVEVRVVPTDFAADWYGLPGGPRFDWGGEPEGGDKELDFNRLLDEMLADEARSALLLDLVANLAGAEGRQVIVFAHRREGCLAIDRELSARGHRTGFLIGGDDYRREYRSTVKGMRSGEVRVGVGTYQACGTGLDLPAVGAGVAVTPIAGNRQFFNQVRGRLCRVARGKGDAVLCYLWDRRVYPGHLDNLLRWNERVTLLERGEWVDARHHRSARRRAG